MVTYILRDEKGRQRMTDKIEDARAFAVGAISRAPMTMKDVKIESWTSKKGRLYEGRPYGTVYLDKKTDEFRFVNADRQEWIIKKDGTLFRHVIYRGW